MNRAYLGAGEMKAMVYVDNLRTAWRSRENYRDENGQRNWAQWAEAAPELAEILNNAELATSEEIDHG